MFADPIRVTDAQECFFYHTIDLPGVGRIQGRWDLVKTIDAYLADFDFRGKRVLDVGTAGGYLAFEAERRGAREVVAFDMDGPERWEHRRPVKEARAAEDAQKWDGFRKAFWYAHRLLNSKVRRFEGDLYHLPERLGRFDVVILGMILPHLRDSFTALEAIAPFTDALLITQPTPKVEGAFAYFIPDPATGEPFNAWWVLSEDCIARMVRFLGFEVSRIVRADHWCASRGDAEECSAVVAVRSAC